MDIIGKQTFVFDEFTCQYLVIITLALTGQVVMIFPRIDRKERRYA